MIILRTNNFSKIEDEDYYNYQNERIRGVKHAKRNTALGLGTLGGILGAGIGSNIGKHPGRSALIGAGIGALGSGIGGYYLGRKIKRDTEYDADYRKKRYKGASESDKKYIRNKLKEERDLAIKERQARALESQALSQSQMAWNSWR